MQGMKVMDPVARHEMQNVQSVAVKGFTAV